jgi:protein-histidine pros-kinase
MQLPVQRAQTAFRGFMVSLAAVLAVVVLALNGMLMMLVVRPVNRLSKIANEVSMGNLEVPDFQLQGKDEIAQLAGAFSRMRKSLTEAIKLLEPSA